MQQSNKRLVIKGDHSDKLHPKVNADLAKLAKNDDDVRAEFYEEVDHGDSTE